MRRSWQDTALSRSGQRKWKDEARLSAREDGYPEHYKPESVSKIALNRLYVPEDEPPKWYRSHTSLHWFRKDALKEAADIIRNKEAEFVRLYEQGTEDGWMWGVETYPKLQPWYVRNGEVQDTEERKKKKSISKSKRATNTAVKVFLPTGNKIKSMTNKAEEKIKSVYSPVTLNLRKKKTATKPKRKIIKKKGCGCK